MKSFPCSALLYGVAQVEEIEEMKTFGRTLESPGVPRVPFTETQVWRLFDSCFPKAELLGF